jgi:predicted translin family RNA/ssDNA-binding protein
MNSLPDGFQASRDVTNMSKKTIFLLHRIVMEDSTDDRALAQGAAKRGREKLREVQDVYAGLKHELEGDRFWRHQRQVSPGLQEYIEALSFAHYLDHGTLITFEQVEETLRDSNGVPVRACTYWIACPCPYNGIRFSCRSIFP